MIRQGKNNSQDMQKVLQGYRIEKPSPTWDCKAGKESTEVREVLLEG